jgi:concentrative nucleoside transporter, CNT family
MERLISLLGLFVMIGLAWAMSSNRRLFPWRVVIGGLILQFVFAGIMFSSRESESPPPEPTADIEAPAGEGAEAVAEAGPVQKAAIEALDEQKSPGMLKRIDDAFNALINCVDAGSKFMFGERLVLTESVFAFRVLPSIIFFAALMQALYYAGIMQRIVQGLGFVVQRTLGTTGPESLAAAANIFLGQTEAPLVVRPYVNSMTRSELMAIMVPGFGSTAGGVLIAYKMMGVDAGHLLTASLLSAPASLLIAKVMVPETERSTAVGRVKLNMGDSGANLLEAITIGTLEGLKLALNVGAMLIAFLALIAMCDGLLGWAGSWFHQDWSLTAIFSYVFAPVAWIMGIPWEDCMPSGQLLGEKMVANEFVAYLHLGEWIKPGSEVELSNRAVTILTYALCGFANFSSIGIQIGGIGGMAPERQRDLAKLGLRAMLGGALANFMTACIAGVLL